jgi:hypothetical protein
MKLIFKGLLLMLQIALSAIFIDFLGAQMSQRQNIFLTLFEGLIVSLVIILIILNIKNFILTFKKQTQL